MSRDVREKMYSGCNFESYLKQTKIANFKKHSRIVLLTSKTLHCHQCSADFTYLVPLARELFLHSWLTFGDNGLIASTS